MQRQLICVPLESRHLRCFIKIMHSRMWLCCDLGITAALLHSTAATPTKTQEVELIFNNLFFSVLFQDRMENTPICKCATVLSKKKPQNIVSLSHHFIRNSSGSWVFIYPHIFISNFFPVLTGCPHPSHRTSLESFTACCITRRLSTDSATERWIFIFL